MLIFISLFAQTEVAESQTKLQNLETQLAESLSNTRAKEIRIQELGVSNLAIF